MRKLLLILIILFVTLPQVVSQGIRGDIQDMDGEPVPYAAIFIKELTRGTTCNALGKFSLPLPAGTYTIEAIVGDRVQGMRFEANDSTVPQPAYLTWHVDEPYRHYSDLSIGANTAH